MKVYCLPCCEEAKYLSWYLQINIENVVSSYVINLIPWVRKPVWDICQDLGVGGTQGRLTGLNEPSVSDLDQNFVYCHNLPLLYPQELVFV